MGPARDAGFLPLWSLALRFCAVTSDGPVTVPADTPLRALDDEPRTVGQWTTTFHLALVVLDPYTYESSWIIDTAVRILRNFAEADCRTAFLVAADDEGARRFLGPFVQELLVFTDPDRIAIKAMGLERLPAFVHLNQANTVEGAAEGWQPQQWRSVADHLARLMSWRSPSIPVPSDPVPFDGTPALG